MTCESNIHKNASYFLNSRNELMTNKIIRKNSNFSILLSQIRIKNKVIVNKKYLWISQNKLTEKKYKTQLQSFSIKNLVNLELLKCKKDLKTLIKMYQKKCQLKLL